MIKTIRRFIRDKPKHKQIYERQTNQYKPQTIDEPARDLFTLMKTKSIDLLSRYPIAITHFHDMKITHHYYKGATITVCGSVADSFNTASDLLYFIEEQSPNQYLLDMNTETLHGIKNYVYNSEPISSVTLDSLLGKKQAFEFLCNDMYLTNNILKQHDEPVILKYREKQQNIVADMDLTAMHTAALYPESKIFFSKPPDLLLLEDIVLNFDKEYLKGILYEVLKTLNKEHVNEHISMELHRDNILNAIKNATVQHFGTVLFKKKALFQCSVMEKFLRPSEKAMIHTNYYHANTVSKLMYIN